MSSSKSTKKSGTSSTENKLPQRLKIWNQCSNCGLIIQKCLNEEHSCSAETSTTLTFKDLMKSELKYERSFLFDGQLIGALAEIDNEWLKDLNIAKELLFDFAFLNTQTALLTGFRIGDFLSVTFKRIHLNGEDNNKACEETLGQIVAICWPSNLADQSTVYLNRPYLALNGIQLTAADSNNKLVTVLNRIDESNIKTVKALSLELNKSISSNKILVQELNKNNSNDNDADEANIDLDLLISFIKETYLNKCIFLDQSVFITFMGQRLVFKIVDIQSALDKSVAKNSKSKSLTSNSTIDSLSKKLETGLKINKTNTFIETNMKPVKSPFDFHQSSLNTIAYMITSKTEIKVIFKSEKEQSDVIEKNNDGKADLARFTFDIIGGLEKEIDLLKELFITPFKFENLYKEIGVDLSKGVVLYGPGGCGKSLLAKSVCKESNCNFVELNITQIYSKNYGEAESKMKKVFQEAWQKAPCIIFIDEMDTLCSRRESLQQDTDKRIVSLFSNLVDQSKSKNILFLGTTSKIDLIDLSLRRPGRFDKEIEIPIPNQLARYAIIKNLLKPMKHNLSDEDLLDVSQNCHGYVGADLQMLVQEAGLVCLNRLIANQQKSECGSSIDQTSDLMLASVTVSDLKLAMRKVKPSAMREITFDIPKVYWNQIGGLNDLKKKLHQAITWPIKHADAFKRLNIKAPRGLLMYGPPGCSKTMIAKALATETGLNFIAVKGPELFSKWVGESERMVREIFRKARNAAPAIIFFDEIDAIAMERSNSANKSNNVGDRVLAQLLNEMDGVESLNDVTIVAATNRPDMIDKALMRPGRLDRIVYVRLPDEATRREIFELKLKPVPLADDIDLDYLVQHTEKYSGAEIAAVCNEAAFLALDSDINSAKISMQNFKDALSMVTPRTSDETIKYFDKFSFQSGLHEI